MPIRVDVNGQARNIVDIRVGGATGMRSIGYAYVGDASSKPRLVWQKIKKIAGSFTVDGSGMINSAHTLMAYNVSGGKGTYIYTFRVNGSVVYTTPATAATSASRSYTPSYAGEYHMQVTIADAADSANSLTLNYYLDVYMPLNVSVSASPATLPLGSNAQISWTISGGARPYLVELTAYRNGTAVMYAYDVGSTFYYAVEEGFGTYTFKVDATDENGVQGYGYSNEISVFSYGYTTMSNVIVRSGPGTEYERVTSLSSSGTRVDVYDECAGTDGYIWYSIRYASISGYIRGDLLMVP